MSVLEAGEADRTTTMSPLDEVVSPTSVESELMVTDMLDEHEAALNEHGKRKRDTDGEELTPRKLPSLTRNNNEVGFVLEDSPDDELREDRDDVSLSFSLSNIESPNGINGLTMIYDNIDSAIVKILAGIFISDVKHISYYQSIQ